MTGKVPWSQVKEIVADALGIPADQRAAFVANACGGSDELQREVQSLLAAHEAAPDFIEQPADVPTDALTQLDETVTPSLREGTTVGPYRILRVLGSGGMGTVYLAERADETFQRQVAIKVVAGALARPELVDRFLTERRILAALDHPNIARLIDAGATTDGLPYVVMELVDGEPIDRYCQGRPVRARLELIRLVCAAVHYAHQRLVIHRDIKAGNILVTPDGQPKLLDFGIAKLLERDPGMSERTETMARALTPESASPEQLSGQTITVASDVYSLGVLIYRLLAGRKPFDQESSSYADLVRAICEHEPPPPSRAAARGAPRIDPELDWITMMALRKEPSRRYGSAQQLAEDIGRYLGGRPVIAAPDSWSYRARKFARRRWAAAATIAAVILVLVAGTITTAYQARRAERRFNDVRKLAGSVVGEIYDAIADLPGSTAPRQLLVKRALEYLDSLAAEAGSDVTLQRELADAYEKIGDVQGNPYGANLGDFAGAAATAAKLVEIRQAIYDRQRSNWDDANALAMAHSKVGDVAYGQGRYEDAVSAYRRGIDVLEAHPAPAAQSARAARMLSRWYARTGVTLTTSGRSAEASAALLRAIDLIAPVANAPGADDSAKMELAVYSTNLGDLYHYQRDFKKGLDLHLTSAEIFRRLVPADSQAITPRRRLALILARVGAGWLEVQEYEKSAAVTREVIALYEEMVNGDPNNIQYKFDLSDVLGNLAMALEKAGHLEEAFATVQRAIAVADAAYAQNPRFTQHRFNYASALLVRAEIQMKRGNLLDAVREYHSGLQVYGEPGVADRNPAVVPLGREGLGDALAALARQEKSAARWREARTEFTRALAEWNVIKGRGELAAHDAGKPAALEKKITECDSALNR